MDLKEFEKYSDEELIGKFHAGETEVMDYILSKYKPLVRKKTNALYLIGGDNDDLIQEGMIGLFKAVRDYDVKQENSFSNFAQMCVSRQLYTALETSNRKKHQPLNTYISFSLEDGEEWSVLEDLWIQKNLNPEEQILEKEKLEELQLHVRENLSEMELEVLQLYLEGHNYIQIAELLNKNAKSIDNALQRIRQKIRQLQR